jgi:hypothetical protein
LEFGGSGAHWLVMLAGKVRSNAWHKSFRSGS